MGQLQSEESKERSHKRTFFYLSLLSILGMGLIFALFIFLLDPRLRQISSYISPVMMVIGIGALSYLLGGVLLAALAIHTGKPIMGNGNKRHWATKALLPAALLIGRLIGLHKEEIQRSFLEVNNALTQSQLIDSVEADSSILVLVPHCLQFSGCGIRVTNDLHKCKSCGKCDLGSLRELMEEMPNVTIAVATGGEVARQIVKKTRPKLIIAVACERDLTEGIRDIPHLPVMGILNHRPNGPCKDTCVNVNLIKTTLEKVRKT